VNVQRQRYKTGRISEGQIRYLEEMGFVWDPARTQWDEGFQKLREYKNKHGDCNVPYYYRKQAAC
jgi:Helicase associated domain.